MKVMAGISKTIDRIVKAIGMFAAYLSVLIMFLIVAEVFMRRVSFRRNDHAVAALWPSARC